VPQRTLHFTGSVRLSKQAPEPEQEDPVVRAGDAPALTPQDVYRLYFHGPAYQVVAEGWRVASGAAGRLSADLPANHEPPGQPTALAPRLVELCFQVAGLWEAGREGRLALPAHVDRLRVVGDVTAGAPAAGTVAVAVPSAGADGCFDCHVLDPEGRVLLRVEGYRTIPLPGGLTDEVRAPLHRVMAD
jgi:hypothetical protein